MKRLLAISVLLFLALPLATQAQVTIISTQRLQPALPLSLNYNGSGARSLGMGGAYLGVSNDLSALSWNPAGLNPIDRPMLSIAWQSYRPGGTFSAFTIPSSRDRAANFSGVSQVAFAAPVRIKGHHFVGSFNYYRAYDEYRKDGNLVVDQVPTGNINDTTLSDFSAETGTSFQTAGDIFGIGFGTRLYNKLWFGPSINIYTGTAMSLLSTDYQIDRLYDNFDGQYRQLQLISSLRDSMKFSGVNFTLGFKYVSDKLSTGLVIKTPFTLELETDSRIESRFFSQGLPTFEQQDVLIDDIVTTISMPLIVGVGGGYQLTEQLLVSGDFEYRSYSSTQFKLQTSFRLAPDGTKERTFVTIDPSIDPTLEYLNLDNTYAVRVGSEYVVKTGLALLPTIPLRLGGRIEKLPSPGVQGIYNPSGLLIGFKRTSVSSLTLSAGFGIQWSQIKLDAGYSHTRYDTDYLVGIELIQSPDPAVPLIKVVDDIASEVRENKFVISFTGYF